MSDKREGVNISGGTFGVTNFGTMDHIKSISVNIGTLESSGNHDIAQGLKELTEAFNAYEELENQQKEEALQLLDTLSSQAATPPEKRLPSGVIKATVTSFGAIASGAGGLAKVWDTWGDPIKHFFGL